MIFNLTIQKSLQGRLTFLKMIILVILLNLNKNYNCTKITNYKINNSKLKLTNKIIITDIIIRLILQVSVILYLLYI